MRISDWSSDVCSSDLRDPKRQGVRRDPKQQRPAKSQRGILERESMQYDVVIVGAGPAGLAAAIRLRQLSAESGKEITVCVLEKGSEVGAHILSGAVLEPRALNELISDWQEKGATLNETVSEEKLLWLSEKGRLE